MTLCCRQIFEVTKKNYTHHLNIDPITLVDIECWMHGCAYFLILQKSIINTFKIIRVTLIPYGALFCDTLSSKCEGNSAFYKFLNLNT